MRDSMFEGIDLSHHALVGTTTSVDEVHYGGYQVVDGGLPPFRHNDGDAGYDMYATETMWIFPFIPRKIPVNLKVELPRGHFGMLTGRSGESARGNIVAPGIIDYNYRGQMSALLYRVGFLPRKIEKGTRIAQLLVIPYRDVNWKEKDSLSETERGTAGFGNSGRK